MWTTWWCDDNGSGNKSGRFHIDLYEAAHDADIWEQNRVRKQKAFGKKMIQRMSWINL